MCSFGSGLELFCCFHSTNTFHSPWSFKISTTLPAGSWPGVLNSGLGYMPFPGSFPVLFSITRLGTVVSYYLEQHLSHPRLSQVLSLLLYWKVLPSSLMSSIKPLSNVHINLQEESHSVLARHWWSHLTAAWSIYTISTLEHHEGAIGLIHHLVSHGTGPFSESGHYLWSLNPLSLGFTLLIHYETLPLV